MRRQDHPDQGATYQDTLDEAIEETFPASDPIAPAVERAHEPVSTRRNRIDWKLSSPAPAPASCGDDPDMPAA